MAAATTGFLKNVVDPMGKMTSGEMGVCFVTSGTGVLGHRVVHELLAAGHKTIRVGVYKGPREFEMDKSIGKTVFKEFEDKGLTVITFDITNEESYVMALAGVKSVFCTMPHIQEPEDTFNRFVDACRKAGVEHFVKMSFYFVGKTPKDTTYSKIVPLIKKHQGWDDHLTSYKVDSRMTYTILGTPHLMSTPLVQQGPVLRKDHKYVTASYAMGINYVSPNDVAKAAVKVLTNRKDHRNKCYNLTGAKPTTDKEVAVLLSKFYGTEIEYVSIGYHEFEDEYKKRGWPDWLVKDMANFEKVKASGYEEEKTAYTKDLRELTEKKPESFAAYLKNMATMTIQEKEPAAVEPAADLAVEPTAWPNDEPAAVPEEPAAVEPAAKTDEPAAKTDEPAAKTEEAAAKTKKHAAKTEKHAVKTEKPAAKKHWMF